MRPASVSHANGVQRSTTGPDSIEGAHAPTSVSSGAGRPSVLRNMAHMMSSQVVTWVLGTVAHVLTARHLGPEGVGQLRLAFSLWLIAQVFMTLGTSIYLTLEMARDRDHAAALVGPILRLRVGAFLAASLVIASYALIAGYGAEMALLLAVVGSTILVMTLGDTFSAALVGLEQMAYPAITTVISKFAYTAVLVGILLLGGGVVTVAAATTFNAVLSLVLLHHFYRRFCGLSFRSPPGASLGRIVRASSGFLLAGAIVVVYLQVDILTIAFLVNEETLGWYSTADHLAGSLLFLPSILMATLFPVIGRLHSVDESAKLEVVQRAFSALFVAGVAIGFGTIVVAEPICVLLFGESFRQSGAVLAVLGLMMPFIFCTMMVATVAMATGRQRFWNTIMIVAVIMSIGLDIILVPLMHRVAANGAIGGAISYVITEAFMLAVGVWKIVPSIRSRESLGRITKSLVAGFMMVAAAWPFRDMFLLYPIAVGSAVFVASAVGLGVLSVEERELATRLVRRLTGRDEASRSEGQAVATDHPQEGCQSVEAPAQQGAPHL
jgi:O-antigen/teichoic acid export membrane protein